MAIKKTLAALCAATSIALALPAFAQELKAERMTNVVYHQVEFIKFKEGGRNRAGEIIEKYFEPAARDSATQEPMSFHMATGEWDYVDVWTMTGGMADMEWSTHPDEVKWMTALRKRVGGEAAAKTLLAEWDTLIAKRVRGVAHRHVPAK